MDWRHEVYARGAGSAVISRKQPDSATAKRLITETGNTCTYCDLTIGSYVKRHGTVIELVRNWDHYTPYAYTGDNSHDNWVLSCQVCNGIKSSLMFADIVSARLYIAKRRKSKGYDTYLAIANTVPGIHDLPDNLSVGQTWKSLNYDGRTVCIESLDVDYVRYSVMQGSFPWVVGGHSTAPERHKRHPFMQTHRLAL
jgi:5-methylcytosine-specific restriction endonuclease McrA